MGLPVASALGFCSGAGQATTERRRGGFRSHAPMLSGLFGAHGAGQVLQAATQSFAQYNPPPENPPIGSALQGRPDISRDPAARQPAPTSPAPQVPRTETEGDRGKLTTPLIVGGFLVLLVALYFLAK